MHCRQFLPKCRQVMDMSTIGYTGVTVTCGDRCLFRVYPDMACRYVQGRCPWASRHKMDIGYGHVYYFPVCKLFIYQRVILRKGRRGSNPSGRA